MPSGARRRFVDGPAGRLHAVELGPENGPPVLLLHGFPEFWWGWRRQLPALAAAGFRAVAADLRGYHLSTKPRGVGAYRVDRLAEDVRALLDDLGPAPHPVIAHDWGGVAAWWSALLFPARISRLAVLNAPHPTVFRRALRTSREQRRRSRYMLYFQLPWLPERKLAADGFRPLRSMLRRTSRPGTFTADELDRYAAAMAVPGALTATLNWYRAAFRRRPPRPPSPIVTPAVRILWGTADVALGAELVEPSARLCREVEVFRIPEAGHWVQHEEPERVNELLVDFLAAGKMGKMGTGTISP